MKEECDILDVNPYKPSKLNDGYPEYMWLSTENTLLLKSLETTIARSLSTHNCIEVNLGRKSEQRRYTVWDFIDDYNIKDQWWYKQFESEEIEWFPSISQVYNLHQLFVMMVSHVDTNYFSPMSSTKSNFVRVVDPRGIGQPFTINRIHTIPGFLKSIQLNKTSYWTKIMDQPGPYGIP